MQLPNFLFLYLYNSYIYVAASYLCHRKEKSAITRIQMFKIDLKSLKLLGEICLNNFLTWLDMVIEISTNGVETSVEELSN